MRVSSLFLLLANAKCQEIDLHKWSFQLKHVCLFLSTKPLASFRPALALQTQVFVGANLQINNEL